MTAQAACAAAFLAPYPLDDLAALLREARGKPAVGDDQPIRRTQNAASALAQLDRPSAWSLLAQACSDRIQALRSGQKRRPEGESPTPWIKILWHNGLAFTHLTEGVRPEVLHVASQLTEGWAETLDELLTAARGVAEHDRMNS